MGIVIRAATAQDEGCCFNLLGVLRAAASDGQARPPGKVFGALLSGERGRILVASDDEVVVGMVTVSYNVALRYGGEYCQLEELIVDPAARGKNVGGLLVQQAVADARARGCAEMGLYLMPSTEHNRPFYEKYGFVALGPEMRQTLR